MSPSLARRVAAEALGTAALLVVVVGSGIMGEKLAGGNEAVALLANSLATAAGLYVIILSLAPISGAHFNPAVTMVEVLGQDMPWGDFIPYLAAQVAGAIAGVWIAHGMFGLAFLQVSTKPRPNAGMWLGEVVATFGLVACIRLCSRCAPASVPAVVGAYIGAAYWFTSSTSFANPAVTVARTLTDTFTGIEPSSAPGFIGAQLVGAVAALAVTRWLRE